MWYGSSDVPNMNRLFADQGSQALYNTGEVTTMVVILYAVLIAVVFSFITIGIIWCCIPFMVRIPQPVYPGPTQLIGPPPPVIHGKDGCNGWNGCDGTQIYLISGSPTSSTWSCFLKKANPGDIVIDVSTGNMWQMVGGTWILRYTMGVPPVVVGPHQFNGPLTFNSILILGNADFAVTAASIIDIPAATPMVTLTGLGNVGQVIDSIIAGTEGQMLLVRNNTGEEIATGGTVTMTNPIASGFSSYFRYESGAWVQVPTS